MVDCWGLLKILWSSSNKTNFLSSPGPKFVHVIDFIQSQFTVASCFRWTVYIRCSSECRGGYLVDPTIPRGELIPLTFSPRRTEVLWRFLPSVVSVLFPNTLKLCCINFSDDQLQRIWRNNLNARMYFRLCRLYVPLS